MLEARKSVRSSRCPNFRFQKYDQNGYGKQRFGGDTIRFSVEALSDMFQAMHRGAILPPMKSERALHVDVWFLIVETSPVYLVKLHFSVWDLGNF